MPEPEARSRRRKSPRWSAERRAHLGKRKGARHASQSVDMRWRLSALRRPSMGWKGQGSGAPASREQDGLFDIVRSKLSRRPGRAPPCRLGRIARADEPGSGRVSSARSRASSDALCARTIELPRRPLASLASAALDGGTRRDHNGFDPGGTVSLSYYLGT
jgi:hypothetical protein